MKKIILFILLLIAIAFSVFAAALLTNDYKKTYQNFLLSVKINPNSAEGIKYKIVKFPIPHLVIDNISEEGKIEIKDIEIYFSLLSLLKFDPQIIDLKAGEAIIYLINDDINFINHDLFISELIKKEYSTMELKIDKLIFVESDKDIAFEITNFVYNRNNNLTQFSGNVDSTGKLSGFFQETGDKNKNLTEFDLNLQGNGFKFLLKENYENNELKSGKAEILSSNLPNKIGKLFPDISAISKNFNSDEEVKITFEVNPEQKFINLKNITIDSNSLQGTGEIALSKAPSDLNNTKFKFTKIDLNSWKKSESSATNQIQMNYGNRTKFDFTNNKLKADLTISHLKFDNNNFLENVEFACNVENGKLLIEKFSGKLNQNGLFKIIGEASQNSFRSLFEGKIALSQSDLNDAAELIGGKEIRTDHKIPYTLIADVKMSSVDVSLQNILLKTPATEVSGNISTKFIGNSPRTNASLNFSAVNVSDKSFPGLFQIYNYVNSLTSNMKDDDYLNKFIPLRKVASSNNYSLSFNKLIVDGTIYENVIFNLGISPGHLRVNNLYLSNGIDHIDADIGIIASGVKPEVNIKINDGSIEVGFLKPETMLALSKKIVEEYALGKIYLNMNFTLSKIYQDNIKLNNVRFVAKNNNILLDISKFETDLFKGRFISAGSILLEPYTVNLVYALNSASVESITNLFPEGLINSGGAISASGMISTNGNKVNELLYNLYTKSLLITKGITIKNFSIDNLIEKVTSTIYDIDNFKDDIKTALLTGDTLIDDLKSSDVELSKGLVTMPSIAFKTKYTAGSARVNINIYDFTINLNSILSFYLSKPKKGRNFVDNTPLKITVNATGSIFAPKKEAITKEFEELLNLHSYK